jgi:hypothetical protein
MSANPNAQDAALTYVARGFTVVPINWPTPTGCSCRRGATCPSPAKHPWVKWKETGGTLDPDLVRWYYRKHPTSGVAITTGAGRSGLFILDVDEGGAASLAALQAEHGELPETLEAITGSRGRHLVFRVTGPSPTDAGQLGAHVDRRGDGGLVVVAPTLHRSGRRYQWRNWGAPIAPAPDWVLRSTRPARTITPAARVAAMYATGDDLLDHAARVVCDATEGTRHHTIVRASWWVAALVAAGKVDEHTARRVLTDAASRGGYDDEKVADAIDSAFAKRRAA